MKTVDFSNLVLGRAATKVAKSLLNGEPITIVNAEKAVIRGNKDAVMEKFKRRQGWTAKGNTAIRSAKISRTPDRLVKWTIKHMLPTNKPSGKTALSRLQVYAGAPAKYAANAEKWSEFENDAKKNFWTIAQIASELGWSKKQ